MTRLQGARLFVVAVVAFAFAFVRPVAGDEVSIAVHFITSREGFEADPYQDAAGNWTVGYGHLLTGDPPFASVTEHEAEQFLADRVRELVADIDAEVCAELDDEQYAALASLAYNIGAGAFDRSQLLTMLNDGAPPGEVMREWLSWSHDTEGGERKVSRGLSARRAMEVGLFYFATSDLRSPVEGGTR